MRTTVTSPTCSSSSGTTILWHLVPEDLFALDLRNAAGKPLGEHEAKARYREFLLEVELVQLEQAALLKCLARHHGLRRVLYEGLTKEETAAYPEKVAELREAEPALREQHEEARRLLKGMAEGGKQNSERYAKALALEKEALALLAEHRLDVSVRRPAWLRAAQAAPGQDGYGTGFRGAWSVSTLGCGSGGSGRGHRQPDARPGGKLSLASRLHVGAGSAWCRQGHTVMLTEF
jgi:hypothetical protein